MSSWETMYIKVYYIVKQICLNSDCELNNIKFCITWVIIMSTFLHYSSFYRQPGIVSPLMAQKTMGRSLFFPHWPKIIMHVQKLHQHLPRYKPPQCPQNTPHQTTTHCAHIIHKARYIYFFHQNNTPYPLSNTPMPDESQKDETVVLSKISPAKNESW